MHLLEKQIHNLNMKELVELNGLLNEIVGRRHYDLVCGITNTPEDYKFLKTFEEKLFNVKERIKHLTALSNKNPKTNKRARKTAIELKRSDSE